MVDMVVKAKGSAVPQSATVIGAKALTFTMVCAHRLQAGHGTLEPCKANAFNPHGIRRRTEIQTCIGR